MTVRRFITICVLLVGANASNLQGQPTPSASQTPTPAPTPAPTPKPTLTNTQQEVQAAEQKWLEAYYSLDIATLEADESDELTFIVPVAIGNKAAQIQTLRDLAAERGSLASSGSFSVSNQNVKAYGDIAVVSEIFHVIGNNPLTSPGLYYLTEVWHREDGKWKIVHFHISEMAHRM